jgi:hypothetical protein
VVEEFNKKGCKLLVTKEEYIIVVIIENEEKKQLMYLLGVLIRRPQDYESCALPLS